jgi:peptidoglycan DL-endopeptidase LytE
MRGRCSVAIIFAAIVLTFGVFSGHAKTGNSAKSNSKTKKTGKTRSDSSCIVKSGDSLNRIASSRGTTVSALKTANNLKSNTLQVGQKLKVPSKKTPQMAEKVEKKAPESLPAREIPTLVAAHEVSRPENPADDPLRLQLVQAGFQFIGVKYHRGGTEETGFDCSGLVKTIFSKFNIRLPRTSREQYQQGEKIDRDKLEVGDLVFFSSGGKNPTHVGMYIGDNKFIHAALKARQVIVSDLDKIWYSMRYLGARRVIWGDDPAPEPQN